MTSAVTRDQQANCGFAAEITAPEDLTGSRQNRLSRAGIDDLAAELQIGADVVAKQAQNNGVMVGRG